MFDEVIRAVQRADKIIIIQAENPDGDSVGSSLALEEILGDLGKQVTLYCPVAVPKHLRYIRGWDRITDEFDSSAELAIIVDTSADVLLSKVLDAPSARAFLTTHPVLVLDHHATESTLSFDHTLINQDVVATGELIYNLAQHAQWAINSQAAENLLIAIMSDSLGLTTQNTTADSIQTVAELTRLGASNAAIEVRRRDFMKKVPEILRYKGRLIERIEYMLDGRLALIHIPWEEIQEYSDQYNPSMLVLDEMRLVEGVDVAIAIKTYPDGKLTGKIRSNAPVAAMIAGYFGGGGHAYAAGWRMYEDYQLAMREIVEAASRAFVEYDESEAAHGD